MSTSTHILPSVRPGKGTISRITVESNTNGKRFVISIHVAARMAASELRALLAQTHREVESLTASLTTLPEGTDLSATTNRIAELNQTIADSQIKITSLVDIPAHYEYFSTPLSSPDSIRINTQQLRAAFPELMPVTSDMKVFETLLTKRSQFMNREVAFTVTDQVDPTTKVIKTGPKGQVYTNVRLEASGDNLSEADALSLLASSGNTPNATTADEEADISM